MNKKLLINFVYYRPVGHLVEALKYAKGYYEANKNLDVYLLLNSDQPLEIVEACSWVKRIYPIKIAKGFDREQLKSIPKTWDYIISDVRVQDMKRGWDEDDLINSQAVIQNYFKAKIASGHTRPHTGFKVAAPDKQIIPYKLNARITIPVPERAVNFVKRYNHRGTKICILLGGSAGFTQSPSTKVWLKICQALNKSIPDLKIYFTGITKSVNGRTATEDFTKKDVEYLINNLATAEDCFNIGLWNQLALIKKCDIFLSPHTGFAFLAPTVGTPWLALSNCRWQEYLFNGLKFYSVLPDCGYYPAQGETKRGCGKLLSENKKCLCMTDKLLLNKIAEIVKGARLLLDRNFTYQKAVDLHFKKIKNHPKIDINKFFFFDGVEGMKTDK